MSPIKNRKISLEGGWITLGFTALSYQPATQSAVRGSIRTAHWGYHCAERNCQRRGLDLSGEFSITFPTNASLIFPYDDYLNEEPWLVPCSSPALTAHK